MTKNYAAQCAMLCGEPAFHDFLRRRVASKHANEPWAEIASPTDAVIAVRVELDIDSRRELNADPDKADAWRALVRDYEGAA